MEETHVIHKKNTIHNDDLSAPSKVIVNSPLSEKEDNDNESYHISASSTD
jgi:hypothetical protein